MIDINTELDLLPPEQRRRAYEVLDARDSGGDRFGYIDCGLVARYVGGFSEALEPPWCDSGVDIILFEQRTGDLPGVITVEKSEPGDLVILSREGRRRHFGIVTSDGFVYSMLGQNGALSVDSLERLMELYEADTAEYYRKIA